MSDEEEDIVIIEDGARMEEFTVAEANDALVVQARFQLDTKPLNVLNRRNKEIKFGKLKNGFPYKLPKLKEEEEVGIIIEDGYRKEEFTVEEANDAALVQARLDLDDKPLHVLNIRDKEIPFGKLIDGVTYKLSKTKEELGIFIEDGQVKEKFTVMEANNSEVVKARFILDITPPNLLNSNDKQVQFGKLIDGMTYKLPKSQILIPNQKDHTQNAIILSKAVKEKCPTAFVNEVSKTHTIMSICDITKYSKQKIMLAIGEVGRQNVLYVAYAGNASKMDFTKNIHMKPRDKENPMGEIFYAEFENRSHTVPIEYIFKCAEDNKCKTIVTCGHSLGGSVSSIVALDLMNIVDRPNVYNITFGAPFFGNEAVRKMCKDEGFERKIINYVDFLDTAPGLMFLDITTKIIINENITVTDKSVLNSVIKYSEESAVVRKFLNEKVPLVQANNADEEDQSGFLSLCSDIIADFEKTGLGKLFTDVMFAPIGTYIHLKNGFPSILDSQANSAQLLEKVFKDPITKVKNISEIKDGCSIDSYYKNLASNSKVDLPPREIDFVHEGFFKPKVIGKASIVWTKYEDEKWRCQLAVRGHFLKSLQMRSTFNDFSGMPFKATSKCINVRDGKNEVTFISEKTKETMEIMPGQTVHLKLTTPFGIIQVVSKIRKSSLELDFRNISVEEPVATIINKSVSRSLSISDMVDGGRKHNDELKCLIDRMVERLDPIYRQKYEELYRCSNPHSRKDDISKVTEKIIESITREITIYQETDYTRYKENMTKKEKGLSGKNKENQSWWESIGMFFSWFFGRGEEIEADYVQQLNTVIHEITCSGILQTDTEKNDLLGELTQEENFELNPKSAYLLENLLMLYEKDRDHLKNIEVCCLHLWENIINGLEGNNIDLNQIQEFLTKEHINYDEFIKDVENIISHITFSDQYKSEVHEMLFSLLPQLKQEVSAFWYQSRKKRKHALPTKLGFPRKSNNILGHLREQSKIEIENKISIFRNMHALRNHYGKQWYIGFIGPQNAGKTTLLNALFGRRGKTGMRTHTEKPTKYDVSKNIFAIDFPGSDSIADQMCACLESSGHMNNFQVYVMQYNGSPNQQMIANVKMAYRLKMLSGKASKTIFCLNKSSAMLCEDNESFTDQYRTEYVQQIKEHIRNHPYDETEESLWKRLKESTKEQFGSKLYEEIAQANDKLKEYTLNEIKDDDFMFTDWIDKEAYKKGIMGPQEVRKKIREFLVKHNVQDILDN